MDKVSRLKALLAMGMQPQVNPSLAVDQKEDLMGQDISQDDLRQFAGNEMYQNRGYEDFKRVQDPTGASIQRTQLSPEEFERKKLALQQIIGGR